MIPFPFDARPDLGVFFPSVVILLHPREWQDVEAGRLPLPAGWDLRAREDLQETADADASASTVRYSQNMALDATHELPPGPPATPSRALLPGDPEAALKVALDRNRAPGTRKLFEE